MPVPYHVSRSGDKTYFYLMVRIIHKFVLKFDTMCAPPKFDTICAPLQLDRYEVSVILTDWSCDSAIVLFLLTKSRRARTFNSWTSANVQESTRASTSMKEYVHPRLGTFRPVKLSAKHERWIARFWKIPAKIHVAKYKYMVQRKFHMYVWMYTHMYTYKHTRGSSH